MRRLERRYRKDKEKREAQQAADDSSMCRIS
jgi:ribosome-associated translation inhibitor RaiA